MNESEPGVLQRLRRRIRRVPPLLLVVSGAVVAVLMVWGAVEAYRAYDYVQHDNDFCLSCHLMVEPYERFARSAHRDLGCKACHRPTLVTRSTMALTQVLENPDSLEAHAEVPNDVCVECHVEGDPQNWRNVAATAGHRIHLESDDPALADVECVECHSTSVHEFAPSDRTCGQAGCHENQDIQLGGMGALTIHCATCHTFTEPVAEVGEDSVRLALQPQREECLSCHAMRTRLTDFPLAANDPHGGMCGACHNPHEQAEPAQAFESCTTCHTRPDTITPYHRGLAAGVLETCSRCHAAHTFHSDGLECRSCHTDPANPANVTPASGSAPPAQRTSLLQSAVRGLIGLLLPSPAFAQQTPIGFDHAQHTQVECTACHSVEEAHGRLRVVTANDCRSCHHTSPVMQPCTRCHSQADAPGAALSVRRAYQPSVGRAENRTYRFAHARHERIACQECHREGVELSAARIPCSACHEEHHDPGNSCIACHQRPPQTAHTRTAHLSCAGSGCHTNAPVTAAQRTRNLCLGCHQDMTDHQPGRRCEDCHALPPPRQAGAS